MMFFVFSKTVLKNSFQIQEPNRYITLLGFFFFFERSLLGYRTLNK